MNMQYKQHMRIPLKLYQTLVYGMALLLVVSCASSVEPKNASKIDLSSKQKPTKTISEVNKGSITHVNQIGQHNDTLNTAQILSKADKDQLKVHQLKGYVDRCSPNATQSPHQGLDCSELKLRVKRLFRSDDELGEALVTLDRLGRNDNINNAVQDLEGGRLDLSFNSQAIAGSLSTSQTPAPPEKEESLGDILNENGLSINAGGIITNND